MGGPNNEEMSSAGVGLFAGEENVSSKSMSDNSFLDDAANSEGIGFAAATKSPCLNDS